MMRQRATTLATAVVLSARLRARAAASQHQASQTSLARQWQEQHDERQDRASMRVASDSKHTVQEARQYDSACAPFADLRGKALRDAIFDQVRDHHVLSYRQARDHMYGLAFPYVDVQDGVIVDAYTARVVRPDGTRTPDHTNTEHSWPQSKGTKNGPQHSDLHHLFVVDQMANSRRQNFNYGETACDDQTKPRCRWIGPSNAVDAEPSKLGLNAEGEPVFQVRTTMRGDIARAQFYVALRYHLPIDAETEEVLRAWHQADPPDAWERERNRRIELVQGNRNPFVDCPELVDEIADF